MIDTTWTTAPALVPGTPVARPAVGACAVAPPPRPVQGTRVRPRALTGAVPFGGVPVSAGTAAGERYVGIKFQDTTLGLHPPGRPLS